MPNPFVFNFDFVFICCVFHSSNLRVFLLSLFIHKCYLFFCLQLVLLFELVIPLVLFVILLCIRYKQPAYAMPDCKSHVRGYLTLILQSLSLFHQSFHPSWNLDLNHSTYGLIYVDIYCHWSCVYRQTHILVICISFSFFTRWLYSLYILKTSGYFLAHRLCTGLSRRPSITLVSGHWLCVQRWQVVQYHQYVGQHAWQFNHCRLEASAV